MQGKGVAQIFAEFLFLPGVHNFVFYCIFNPKLFKKFTWEVPLSTSIKELLNEFSNWTCGKRYQFIVDDVRGDVELGDEVNLVRRIFKATSRNVGVENGDEFSCVQYLKPLLPFLRVDDDGGRVRGDGFESPKFAVDGLVLDAEQRIVESKNILIVDDVQVAEIDEADDQGINFFN
jgi:hypothetical protein